MIGQAFWPKSTGKGLEALARSGQQKTGAIRQANSLKADTSAIDLSVAKNAFSQSPLRTVKEQDAITGDLFYSQSTGKDSGPLARQIKVRELSVQQRKAARHGRARAEQRLAPVQNELEYSNKLKEIGHVNKPATIQRKEHRSLRSKFPNDHLVTTGEAVDHYFLGDGEAKELGDNVKAKIVNLPRIEWQLKRLANGLADPDNPYIDMDMRGHGSDVFHLGKTNATFTIKCDGPECMVRFKAPMFDKIGAEPDKFADPIGMGIELPFGTSYPYMPFEWERKFKNPNWKKKKD